MYRFFLPWRNSPSGPGPPSGSGPTHYRGFMITLGRTTLVRTPLDEWPAQRRGLYLTTHNTHNRQTSMPPAGFETTIPVSEGPQTHALERTATWVCTCINYQLLINTYILLYMCIWLVYEGHNLWKNAWNGKLQDDYSWRLCISVYVIRRMFCVITVSWEE
jgi:hypothetical protein